MYGVIVINDRSKTYFKITKKNIDCQINEKMHSNSKSLKTL